MEDITSKLDNIPKETSNLPNSGKPPNIVVYSECQSSAICLKETLSLVLEKQRYTVYILNASQMLTAPWLNNVCLLVIAGHISPDITNRLKSYVTDGSGRLLCFGSNLLDAFVPQLSGAEVKDEMGLLTFSKWSRVEVLHRLLKCQFSDEKNGLDRLPTTCINDMIDALNAKEGTKVEHLTLEKFVAILLNRFEQLIDMVERGRIDEVIQLYYKHWLHSGSKVSVRTEDGRERQVTIVGIDNSGFLKVVDKDNRQFSVHPDGNSFDMMSGLIAPKVL